MIMMTKEEILKLVHEIETPQIRAGETHRFKNIWIVVTEGRMIWLLDHCSNLSVDNQYSMGLLRYW